MEQGVSSCEEQLDQLSSAPVSLVLLERLSELNHEEVAERVSQLLDQRVEPEILQKLRYNSQQYFNNNQHLPADHWIQDSDQPWRPGKYYMKHAARDNI